MEREELLTLLRSFHDREWIAGDSPEYWHEQADEALLAYINDPEITEAFNLIDKWYA